MEHTPYTIVIHEDPLSPDPHALNEQEVVGAMELVASEKPGPALTRVHAAFLHATGNARNIREFTAQNIPLGTILADRHAFSLIQLHRKLENKQAYMGQPTEEKLLPQAHLHNLALEKLADEIELVGAASRNATTFAQSIFPEPIARTNTASATPQPNTRERERFLTRMRNTHAPTLNAFKSVLSVLNSEVSGAYAQTIRTQLSLNAHITAHYAFSKSGVYELKNNFRVTAAQAAFPISDETFRTEILPGQTTCYNYYRRFKRRVDDELEAFNPTKKGPAPKH